MPRYGIIEHAQQIAYASPKPRPQSPTSVLPCAVKYDTYDSDSLGNTKKFQTIEKHGISSSQTNAGSIFRCAGGMLLKHDISRKQMITPIAMETRTTAAAKPKIKPNAVASEFCMTHVSHKPQQRIEQKINVRGTEKLTASVYLPIASCPTGFHPRMRIAPNALDSSARGNTLGDPAPRNCHRPEEAERRAGRLVTRGRRQESVGKAYVTEGKGPASFRHAPFHLSRLWLSVLFDFNAELHGAWTRGQRNKAGHALSIINK